MRRMLKKYVIPHKDNDHRPHLLRKSGVLFLLALIVGGLALSSSQKLFLRASDYLASVLPPVLVDLANQDRQAKSLAFLTINEKLQAAAQLKANDMAAKGYFAHNSPTGVTPWYWIGETGYEFSYAGENLAVDFDDSVAVNDAWMNSPGHRENILNSHFTEVGIAVARGVFEGHDTLFVVQMFGTPVKTTQKTSASAIAAQPPETPDVVPIVSTSPSVLGAESSDFIAVRNAAVPDEAEVEPSTPVSSVSYASPIERLATSPVNTLKVLYVVIVALLLVLFIAVLFVRHERRPRHTILVASLVALVVVIYVGVSFMTPRFVEVLGAETVLSSSF